MHNLIQFSSILRNQNKLSRRSGLLVGGIGIVSVIVLLLMLPLVVQVESSDAIARVESKKSLFCAAIQRLFVHWSCGTRHLIIFGKDYGWPSGTIPYYWTDQESKCILFSTVDGFDARSGTLHYLSMDGKAASEIKTSDLNLLTIGGAGDSSDRFWTRIAPVAPKRYEFQYADYSEPSGIRRVQVDFGEGSIKVLP